MAYGVLLPWSKSYTYSLCCLKSAAVTNELRCVIGKERRGGLVAWGAGCDGVTRLKFPGKKMQDLSLFPAKLPITVGMLFTGSAV